MVRKLLGVLCVLVLDAQECNALGGMRSLGQQGVRVTAASHKQRPMGFYSRYCNQRLVCPSPAGEPALYAEWLVDTLSRQHYDALLFFGQASAHVVSKHRDSIQRLTGCLVPPYETFLVADRKDQVARLADSIGIPVPATYELTRPGQAAAFARRITFPAIVKGVQGSGGHQVAFVHTPEQLVAEVRRLTSAQTDPTLPPPVIQEYIPGSGYGLTALVDHGEPVATFMHRRLAEHQVDRGGHLVHAATAAESIDEPQLREHGVALLRALEWEGMAMVEFRRSDRDGRYYLMEVNPRFPGSLDLAIAAGVDFPSLYVQRAVGRSVMGPDTHRIGTRFHWLLSKSLAGAVEDPTGYGRGLLDLLRPGTHCDLSLLDPRPHLVQMYDAAWWLREQLRGPRCG